MNSIMNIKTVLEQNRKKLSINKNRYITKRTCNVDMNQKVKHWAVIYEHWKVNYEHSWIQ